MLGVSAVAWLALLLAEFGQFRLFLLGLLLTIVAVWLCLLIYASREGPAGPAAAAGGLKPTLAATAGILLCAALFLPPYETAVAGGDATAYLNFGRQIARHGALEFEDPLLRSLSPANRAELFLNQIPGDVAPAVRASLDTPPFSRFPGGFLIPDITNPTVTAGFSQLFPVLTALGHALAWPQGALVVAPLFATLSLIGLWCVARRLAHGHAHGRLVAEDLVREALGTRDCRAVFRDGRTARLVGGVSPRCRTVDTRRRGVLGPRLFCKGRSPSCCPCSCWPSSRRGS